ncbi:related to caffeine-induced death protein 1 Cid1 [Cephalotrichum gorgonifer]|uniref:Related to caffeine-induced death protein 1 Cid1 n=1 Tax=Cephalotrichum gorgonifer TaxID=2041049 RepID=A0AAE8N1P3_9PEZI|nr:related to caffeine-induced death protein 1 Cid1 [Cephalotrichum gorgonifer]
MDLGLLSPMSLVPPDAPGSAVPRLIEKAFLDAGLGARLLPRTRVPIIKLCENPPAQLLSDLRTEREKWDSGVGVEDAGASEEPRAEEASPSPSKTMAMPRDVSLSQGETQTLSAYYASAKRLLRKLGGHDLTASNHRNFTGEDCDLLVALSRAFLSGLRDETLRKRLDASPALQLGHVADAQNLRSLLGIYTCVEGEAIMMHWECSPVKERTDELERAVAGAFKSWKILQGKIVPGLHSIHHTKELQVSLERLKKFPSVQLVVLEQGQNESATQYSDRAARLLSELIPRSPDSGSGVGPEVLARYIYGIRNSDVRSGVADLSRILGDNFSLHVAARRHKALQLAHDLEKAQAAGFYPDAARDAVTHYVSLLRDPIQRVVSTDGSQEWGIPITDVSTQILATIRSLRPWDTYSDKFEIPKTGVGVQCDINFSAHLALQNTLLLRCYSHTDPRVRPLILFVKHWAKVRSINTPYRGTLSSYGYVLMALHFLVNVAKPFVCPNLQKLAPPPPLGLSPAQLEETVHCKGRDIRFWRDEREILQLARENRLNQNRQSVGELLRGFFEYYAHGGALSTLPGRGFDWGREVLSLRTAEGILSKQTKGWTGAKTTTIVQDLPAEPGLPTEAPKNGPLSPAAGAVPELPSQPPQKSREVREVRHRYLLAIEDPFELDHNVARTVTHNGVVSIRDEFRRAWRIIQSAGAGREDEDLLCPVDTAGKADEGEAFVSLLADIHGTIPLDVQARCRG